MGLDVGLDEAVGLGVDRVGTPGELLNERLRHDAELVGRVAAWAALPVLPPQPETLRDAVGQCVVVPLGHRDGRPVHRPGVEGAPPPVRPLHPVGDDDVGVQVGVVLAGVPVVEGRRDDTSGLDLGDPVGAHAGAGDVPLDDGEHVLDGLAVALVDGFAGGRIGQGPEDADRLRRR